jgi:hypothetical protein
VTSEEKTKHAGHNIDGNIGMLWHDLQAVNKGKAKG